MSAHSRGTRSARTMVLAFLLLTAAAAGFGMGARYGVIGPVLARRAIGAVIGAMFVVAGNFLPKMRPLNTGGDPSRASASERAAGWALVLVGLADIGLFLFADVDRARAISSIIGIAAIAIIAVNWAWLARGLLFGGHRGTEPPAIPQRGSPEQRRIMAWLLFAIFYLAVTACLKVFVHDPAATDRAGVWMLLTFSILFAFTGYRTSCRKRPNPGSGQPEPNDNDAM